MGITHGYIRCKTTLNHKIRDIVNLQSADVVIDTTGNTHAIEQACKLTHSHGKTIMVGVSMKGNKISRYSMPLHFNKILAGSYGGEAGRVILKMN